MRHDALQSERRTVSPLPMVLASFFGALAYLIVVARHPIEAFHDAFTPPPEKLVWCVLVASQVALWSYLAAPAYKRAARYATSFRSHRRSVITDFVALLLFFGIFAYTHQTMTSGFVNFPVDWQRVKVPPLLLLGFATITPCLLGMRLVAIAARAEAATGANTAMLDKFSGLRDDLRWFLGSATTIIGAATLANGAFRNAINQMNSRAQPLPASEVLLYGGFCSAMLGLFYLTSHDVFSRSAWAVITSAEPVTEDSPGAWAAAQVRRSKLADVLGVSTSAVRAFQDGATILTPFFGSGLGLLLGSK